MTATGKIAAAVTALVALVAVTAGCSSADTKNEYVDTVNAIQADALRAVNESTTVQSSNKAEVIKQLDNAERILADAVAELEQVDVPEEAQERHPKLVAGLDEMRKLFADTAKSVKGASNAEAFADLTTLVAKSSAIGAEIDAAISQINQDLGAE